MIAQCYVFFPICAVIVVLPLDFARILPFPVTDATLGLEDSQFPSLILPLIFKIYESPMYMVFLVTFVDASGLDGRNHMM